MANPLYGQNTADDKLDVLKNVGDGDFSDAKFLSRYLDYHAGYSGNLTATGIAVTEGESNAALAAISSPSAAATLAATLIPFAVNSTSVDGTAAGTIHLPTAIKG